MDAVNGIPLKSYIIEIGKSVNPANIRFVSRISQGRVCFYLDSKSTVDKLIDNNAKINIEYQIIEIRLLISKMKRIILSNVCPIIPHDEIMQVLEKSMASSRLLKCLLLEQECTTQVSHTSSVFDGKYMCVRKIS